MSTNIHAEQKPLIYQIGKHVKLVDDATFCKSIIADGKELITGEEYGAIRVLELKDEKVYITFKEDLTSLANAFSGCSALKSIPENLFANNHAVTDFSFTFFGCKALTAIPEGLFANNPFGMEVKAEQPSKVPESPFIPSPLNLITFLLFVKSFSGMEVRAEQPEKVAMKSVTAGLFANRFSGIDLSAEQ